MSAKHWYISFVIFFVFSALARPQSQTNTDSDTDFLVNIHTSFGDIKLILFEDTPKHRENFLRLLNAGLLDSTLFYRVIDNFVIQGGNPGAKKNLSEYEKALINFCRLPSEIKAHHKNVFGALGAPTRNPGVDSNADHFYIVENANGAHHLDGKYTVFGQVMSGLDVVMKIAEVQTDEKNKPINPVFLSMHYEVVSKKDIEKFYSFSYRD